MSKYEENQVNRLIEGVYLFHGQGLSKEDCVSGCWIVYLEYKKKHGIDSALYWEEAAKCMTEEVRRIRMLRNNRYRVQARISMDQRFGDSKEEIRSILFPAKGDFTNSVVLWDFAGRLGVEKHRIMSYMANGEDDSYIMERMGISVRRYQQIKTELREDMNRYINS